MVSGLPPDIQRRVLATRSDVPPELAECLPVQADPERARRCVEGWEQAPEGKRERARIRLAVVRAFQEFKTRTERGIRPFLREYQERTIRLDADVYEALPELTRSKLNEWEQRYEVEGIAGLVSQKGAAIPRSFVPHEQQQLILGLAAKNPDIGPTAMWRALVVRYDRRAASCSAVKRFVAWQRHENPALWRYLESPDEYKNHHQLALGNCSEKAQLLFALG